MAFHNDVSLVAPVQQLDSVLSWSHENLLRIGVHLQFSKCAILHHPAPSGGSPRAGPTNKPRQSRADSGGVWLHGVPIGPPTSTYVSQQTRRLLLEHERLVKGILPLPPEALPHSFLCSALCERGRSTYILRALDASCGSSWYGVSAGGGRTKADHLTMARPILFGLLMRSWCFAREVDAHSRQVL